MAIEFELRDGTLAWIRNPFTGVISYVVDLRDKSFAFTLGAREMGVPKVTSAPDLEQMRSGLANCPFCPGNESKAPAELMRVRPQELPGWPGDAANEWAIRVINNLFPRIPTSLTGGRNESYIVIEDARHFTDDARTPSDLLYTAALGEAQFRHLLATDAQIVARALDNRAIGSVMVRKNQGRESGASQPHLHQQIIGSPGILPVIDAELAVQRAHPGIWSEIVELMDELGLMLHRDSDVVIYASPFGMFPRSYDIVMPQCRQTLDRIGAQALGIFAHALYRVLKLLGPLPLDFEIHQAAELPLHAHVNARRFPYSNVGGTLNIPKELLEHTSAFRRLL